MDGELLEGQLAYYRARRRVRRLVSAPGAPRPRPRTEPQLVLDGRGDPPGTRPLRAGCWNSPAARGSGRWSSPAALETNRARLREAGHGTHVRYVEADLFGWRPDAAYDAVLSLGSGSRTSPRSASRRSGSSSGPRSGPAGAPSSWTLWVPRPRTRRGVARDPRDYATTRKVEDGGGVPDRQGLLRPRRRREAANRPGMARLRAHDRALPLRLRWVAGLDGARDLTFDRTPAP
jgi:hypothetical protein